MRDTGLYPFRGVVPRLGERVFIAPGARVIGDVEIGDDSSVWYNCVLRGDVHFIRIGARTNIQDGTVIHVTTRQHETIIGDDVLIGHMAMVHGCHLHDKAFVGLGAIVMDGCEIEGDAMLAAGALLTPGKRIPSGQLWAGRPAAYVRDLTEEQISRIRTGTAHYAELAQVHQQSIDAVYEK